VIVRTDAVVLRAFDDGETSRIATVLTRKQGIVGLLAKGARRPSSRFGSTLQPGAHLDLLYYFREGRGLQTLSESSHVTRFPETAAALERIGPAHRLLELVRALLPEGDPQPAILALLLHTLEWIEGASTERASVAVPWFQLRLSASMGFAPDVRREDVLAVGDEGGLFSLEAGTVHARGGETPPGRPASRAALRALAVIARNQLEVAGRMRMEGAVRREVETLVEDFVQFHVEYPLPTRVRRVTGQIEDGLVGPAGT
jgi:DNA repair protein RecO (recombination protein O)